MLKYKTASKTKNSRIFVTSKLRTILFKCVVVLVASRKMHRMERFYHLLLNSSVETAFLYGLKNQDSKHLVATASIHTRTERDRGQHQSYAQHERFTRSIRAPQPQTRPPLRLLDLQSTKEKGCRKLGWFIRRREGHRRPALPFAMCLVFTSLAFEALTLSSRFSLHLESTLFSSVSIVACAQWKKEVTFPCWRSLVVLLISFRKGDFSKWFSAGMEMLYQKWKWF